MPHCSKSHVKAHMYKKCTHTLTLYYKYLKFTNVKYSDTIYTRNNSILIMFKSHSVVPLKNCYYSRIGCHNLGSG